LALPASVSLVFFSQDILLQKLAPIWVFVEFRCLPISYKVGQSSRESKILFHVCGVVVFECEEEEEEEEGKEEAVLFEGAFV
jgi:hypothetical protein